MLLTLLAERPAGGYELMGELRRRFAPRYRPSSGSVYPALAALRAEGLIEPDERRGAGTVRITSAGRRLRASKREAITEIELRTAVNLDESSALEPVVDRFAAKVKQMSGRVDRQAVERILDKAAQAIAAQEGERGQA